MKNFIFALIVFCFYAVANTQAQVYQMDTVFFENFENLDAFGTIPTTIKIFDEDSCDFARTGGASLFGDYFRALSRNGGDTAISIRSNFNMWSFQPGQTVCQANDWAIINQAIDITPTTWLKWWYQGTGDTASGPQYTETYGIYLADTIKRDSTDNFLAGEIMVDTIYTFINRGAYDSLDLSAYAGQRKYIGFRYFSIQKGFYNLDDILVYEKTLVSVDKYTDITYSIYPNPTTSSITVESEEMGDVLIYNALGQLLLQQNKIDTKQNINVSHLQNGLYIVQLQTKKGVVSQKIIKQ